MDHALIASLGAALSDPTRLKLLDLVDGKLAVGEIAGQLGVSSATVSHHVAVLVRAGLVRVLARGPRHLPQRVPGAWRVLAGALD